MYFDKKNINVLIYLGVFIVLLVVLYYSYNTYINYQTSHTLYNSLTDNINETLLIENWKPGQITFNSSNIMPQSIVPTEYSISFLIYLHPLDEASKTKEQIIFVKGEPNNRELTLSIKPLKSNPKSDLRFTCKLQIDVECNHLDKLLDNVCTSAVDDDGGGEQFSNTSSNSTL